MEDTNPLQSQKQKKQKNKMNKIRNKHTEKKTKTSCTLIKLVIIFRRTLRVRF